MTKVITDLIALILGRRALWRLGRSLYLKARGDTTNDMQINGEKAIQQRLARNFASNAAGELVIFDVGANVGDWTLSILDELDVVKANNAVNIYSFEPVPATFQTLQSHISEHRLGSLVHLVPQALSSEDGVAEMFVIGDNAGTNSLHVDAMKTGGGKHVQVRKITADMFCLENGIHVIHYLKCDTEGHDMEVLHGARRLIQENRIMAFQFEYNHRWIYSRHYIKDVFDFVKDTGYSVGKITPRGVEIYEGWHPELDRFFEGNYLLLHPEAINWFATWKGGFDAYNTYKCLNQ